jgi:branched-chain amino acid transport system permease protein/neutral amino acid transport system permease protein
MIGDIIQLLIYGIVTGSILALGAIGVSLVFSILRFAHFAHGDLMTVGAYAALVIVAGLGMPIIVAAPFAILVVAVVAIAIELSIYRPLRQSSPIVLLISSFGMALILRSAVQLIWGTGNQVYSAGIQLPIRVGDIAIKPDHLWIIAGTLALIAALHVFLQYTKFGKAMRAMADNVDLARVTGIPTGRVVLIAWIIAGGLAAMAGIFLAMDTRLHPVMGWQLLLPVFAAAIVGGIGRPYGAMAGGLLIGVAMEMSTMVINPAYKQAVAFALMVATLIVRPTGIFRGSSL